MLNVLSNRRIHARSGDPSSALVNISSATVAPIEPQVYTGDPVTPQVSVTYDGTVLVEGTDYNLTYSSNTEVGTGIVTLIGLGGYTGTKAVQFQIGSSWDFVFRAGQQTGITNHVYSDSGSGITLVSGGYVREYGDRKYLFVGSASQTDSSGNGYISRIDITDVSSGSPIDFTSHDQEFFVGPYLGTTGRAYQFYISEDGNSLFVFTTGGPDRPSGSGYATPFWYEIPLTVPFDLSSAAPYSSSFVSHQTYSVLYDYVSPTVRFSPDGLTMYFCASSYSVPTRIVKVPLTQPFVPTSGVQTSANNVTVTSKVLTGVSSAYDFCFSSDGCRLLVVGKAYSPPSGTTNLLKRTVVMYSISTPWNTSTLSGTGAELFSGFNVSTNPRSDKTNMEARSIVQTGDRDFSVALGYVYCSSYVNIKFPSPDLAISAVVDPIEVQFYTGEAVCPVPVVKVGSLTLVQGTDYTLSYENNVGSASVPVSQASIVIHGIGDFRGTKTVTFQIGHFSNFVTVAAIADQEYAGLVPICPTVSATDYDGNALIEGEDADFTVTYEDNTSPGVATAILSGIYEGCPWTKTVTFNIKCNLSTYGIFGSIPDQAYTTSTLSPVPTMMLADGRALARGTDFDVQEYSNNTGVGTATVTVIGRGFYYGTKSTTFLIRYDADTYMSIEQIGAQLYTLSGNYPTPVPVVHGVNGATLVLNQHYTVDYQYVSPGTNTVGSVTVVVTGIGSYMGIAYSNTAPMNRSLADAYVDPVIPDQPYTGLEIRPDFTLKIRIPTALNANGTVKTTTEITLVRDVDYSIVQWSANTSAGTATATVVGITTNGFGGSLSVNFVISYQAPGTYFAIGSISEQTMTGPVPVTPVPVVTCSNGLTVTRNTDYVVEYENNTSTGTGTVRVRGIGSYSGLDPVTRDFSIVSNFAIAQIADQTYSGGTPVCPKPVVTGWDGTTLQESDDYVLTYENNMDVGLATVILTGVVDGNPWTKTTQFRIKADLSSSYVKFDDIPDQIAVDSDEVVTPDLSVKLDNGTALVQGTDYTVSWSGNTGPGTASVVITGAGDRTTGTKTLGFLIRSSLPVHAVVSQIPDQKLGWGKFGAVGSALPFPVTGSTRQVDGKSKSAYVYSLNSNLVTPSVVIDYEGARLVEGIEYFVDYTTVKPVTFIITGDVSSKDRVVEAVPGEVRVIADGAGLYIGKAYSNTAKIRVDIGCAFIRFGKFSRVYSGVPVKPTIDVYAMYGDTNDILKNMSSPPMVVELDTGRYLGLSNNTLHEYNAAGQDLGTYDVGSANAVWDFNGVALFTKSSPGSNWTKLGSVYQSKLKSTEFSLLVSGNTAPGTATVTARGTNGFAGTVSRSFQILHPFVIDPIPDQKYTGSSISPSIVVRRRSSITEGPVGDPLVLGTDYTVTYSSGRTNVGIYDVTVIGSSSYSHATAVTVRFKIIANTFDVAQIPQQQYTGSAVEPEPVVTDGSTTLVKGTHYTVSYSSGHTEPGTYSATVTGIGAYSTVSETVTFRIVANTFNVDQIQPQQYTGSAVEPEPVVTDGSTTLVKGTHYTVSYSSGHTETGIYDLTVTGIGLYAFASPVTLRYTISSRAFSVDSIVEQTYTGSSVKPNPTVTDGSTVLVKGTDYTVSYPDDSVSPGEKTLVVRGLGDYLGTTVYVTYNVVVNPETHPSLISVSGIPSSGSVIEIKPDCAGTTTFDEISAYNPDTGYRTIVRSKACRIYPASSRLFKDITMSVGGESLAFDPISIRAGDGVRVVVTVNGVSHVLGVRGSHFAFIGYAVDPSSSNAMFAIFSTNIVRYANPNDTELAVYSTTATPLTEGTSVGVKLWFYGKGRDIHPCVADGYRDLGVFTIGKSKGFVVDASYQTRRVYTGEPVVLDDLVLTDGLSGYVLVAGTDYTVSYSDNTAIGSSAKCIVHYLGDYAYKADEVLVFSIETQPGN